MIANAIDGIVENGRIRLDEGVSLPEIQGCMSSWRISRKDRSPICVPRDSRIQSRQVISASKFWSYHPMPKCDGST